MLDQGAKAIVIACNTATSVAAATLRAEHPEIPVVGIEPALKPATEAEHHSRILVMATETTIRLDKFHRLARAYGSHSDIVTVPCAGLADLVETGKLEGRELRDLLEEYLGDYRGAVDGVVLGCTHYPFVARQIQAIVGDVPLYDGGPGTARQTRRLLEQGGLLAPSSQAGGVEFRSSNNTPEQLELYRHFYRLPLP
jgi:glutamate racemase